jgi:hypothetical protein
LLARSIFLGISNSNRATNKTKKDKNAGLVEYHTAINETNTLKMGIPSESGGQVYK